MNFEKSALQAYLHDNIPIVSALGVNVELLSPHKVALSAPFSKNLNHKMTVFGGSLHAVATLACWSLIQLHLDKECGEGFQLVIAHSDVAYLCPVDTDFTAEARMPEPKEWERFIKTLQRKGKARIHVRATVMQKEILCVDYSGVFVALRP